MKVVLICPRCKKRVIVDYANWVESKLPAHDEMICDNPLCDKKPLIYHKDVGDVDIVKNLHSRL